MIELVIFDCDGVLVDSEPIAVRVDVEMLAEVGVSMSEAEVIERYVGRSPEVMVAETEARLGRRVPDDWFERGEARIRKAYVTELAAVPGIVEALAAIEEPVCVASSSGHESIRFKLELTGLHERFAGRIFSATEVANGKPAPDLFLHAARQMSVGPAAVCGDRGQPLRGAGGAGRRDGRVRLCRRGDPGARPGGPADRSVRRHASASAASAATVITTLGNSGLPVTRIGLGLAALGRPAYINLGHASRRGGRYGGRGAGAPHPRRARRRLRRRRALLRRRPLLWQGRGVPVQLARAAGARARRRHGRIQVGLPLHRRLAHGCRGARGQGPHRSDAAPPAGRDARAAGRPPAPVPDPFRDARQRRAG